MPTYNLCEHVGKIFERQKSLEVTPEDRSQRGIYSVVLTTVSQLIVDNNITDKVRKRQRGSETYLQPFKITDKGSMVRHNCMI